jgi:hypothetical protein
MIDLLSLKIKIRNMWATTTMLCILALVLLYINFRGALVLFLITILIHGFKELLIHRNALPKKDYDQLTKDLVMGEDELLICDWKPYPGDYDKCFAQVITKGGEFVSNWYWPNDGKVGTVLEKDIKFIRYAKWRDL